MAFLLSGGVKFGNCKRRIDLTPRDKMIAVIFELEPKASEQHAYFSIAAELKPLVEKAEGLISLERFQRQRPGKIYS